MVYANLRHRVKAGPIVRAHTRSWTYEAATALSTTDGVVISNTDVGHHPDNAMMGLQAHLLRSLLFLNERTDP